MTLREFFLSVEEKLKKSTFHSSQRDIEDLASFHLGWSWSELKLKSNEPLSIEVVERIGLDLNRYLKGEPMAYIIGEKDFYKHTFKVDARALIPRPETELIVQEALSHSPNPSDVVDLGAGSGCIGLSLAKEWPQARIHLVDTSEQALGLCRENAALLEVSNVEFIHCKVGRETAPELKSLAYFDLVVANPPYIQEGDTRVEGSVHDYEPHQALYAEEGGLLWIRLWLDWSFTALRSGGFMIFEFGENQESKIDNLIQKTDFTFVQLVRDYSGIPRIFVLKKP